MFDLNHYSIYYSLDNLYDELRKQNIDIDQIKRLDNNKIFKLAVEYGFIDVAEYLFVHHGIEFEINDLTKGLQTTIKSHSICMNAFETPVTGNGANDGLTLRFMNLTDYRKNAVIDKLLYLRKYSILYSRNCKFWYKFNKKFIKAVYV